MNDNNFKPFDKVLVRQDNSTDWACDLYSHYVDNLKMHCCVGGLFSQAIPYEGNEHLLGTKDSPQPKRWRANRGEYYWYIDSFEVCLGQEDDVSYNDKRYNIGNYFRTREEAAEMAVKFRDLLKGE